MTLVDINTAGDLSSDQGTVDYDALTIGDAQPNNLAGYSNVWTAEAKAADGTRYAVSWSFSDEEAEVAGDDAGNLPWDAVHVVRVSLI